MHFKLLAAGAVTALMLFTPAAADAACCDQVHQAHAAKACCADHHPSVEPSIVERFQENDPQLNPAPPVRQAADVWFTRPTLIGSAIVQGRYVIEHDNDRMARGERCTHVYAFDDRTKPVAAFQCTHLERPRADQNSVSLTMAPDGMMKVLTEFQFAGETAAHGYPTMR